MKYLRVIIPLVVLAMFLIPSAVGAEPTVTYYEFWTGATGNYSLVYAGHWSAQSFVLNGYSTGAYGVAESHTIFGVHLSLWRVGDGPGDIVVGVREADEWGRPIGDDLVSGVIDGSLVANATLSSVFLILMSPEQGFSYNETYSIVVSASSGDSSDAVRVYSHTSTPTPYAYGNELTSDDGGLSWTQNTDTDMFFAIRGRPLLDITDVQVFGDYYEDGDMLFTIAYENFYVPYYPTDDAPSYFMIQLRDTDGTTLIAQTVCRQWGYMPAEIYLNADSAAPLDSGQDYMIVLEGSNLFENPSSNYTLGTTDWKGSDLSLLRTWAINLAKDMEEFYDIELVAASGSKELLNDQGGVFFLTGMPSLANLVPNIFEGGELPEMGDFDSASGAFDSSTTWSTELGGTVTGAVEDTASLLGVGAPQNMAAIILMFGYFALAGLVIAKGGDVSIAAIMGIPVVLAGAHFRIFPWAFIMTISSVVVLLLMYRFWWSRT